MFVRIFSLDFLKLDDNFVLLDNEFRFVSHDILLKIVFDQSVVLPIQIGNLGREEGKVGG